MIYSFDVGAEDAPPADSRELARGIDEFNFEDRQ
jgi:hypothetical protein